MNRTASLTERARLKAALAVGPWKRTGGGCLLVGECGCDDDYVLAGNPSTKIVVYSSFEVHRCLPNEVATLDELLGLPGVRLTR